MARDTMANSSRTGTDLPAYEMIQRNRIRSHSFSAPSEPDDDLDKPTSRLPPKPLPGRRKYRPFMVAFSLTAFTIMALAMLLSKIKKMLPHPKWTGLVLEGTSCDLVDRQNSSRLESAFQINLRGAAHLTFAEAKFIDLFFDVLVGQGGRFLLAAISYIIVTDALLRSMETTPVSYKLYSSLVFSSTSLAAAWHSIKAISTTKGWRAKTYFVWCALAMIYVLAFPTLIESATGYVSPSSAGFNIANGTMVQADSNNLTSCLNVTGGIWLGLDKEHNNTIAQGPPAHTFDPMRISNGYKTIIDKAEIPSFVDNTTLFYALITARPEEIWNATNSTKPPYEEYRDCEDQAQNATSCDYINYDYTTNVTVNGKVYKLNNTQPIDLWDNFYCYGETLIDPYEVHKQPYCLQIIWTFGMFCVWLDANLASELVRNGRTIRGPFRAAADLVEAMNETLGPEYCSYSDKEIAKTLDESGDQLRYNSTLRDDDGLLHVGLTTRWPARILLSSKKLYGARGGN
ncbi:MAG: hypothetical protein Q9170_005399 [Blastenia crenularia]